MIKLIGILIVIVGASFEVNPILTILTAAFATGMAGGMEPIAVLEMIGNAFTTHRFLSIFLLTLPLVGLLERRGLYEKIEANLERAKGATVGHILQLYMTIRQTSVAVGVLLAGHAMARTLVAPMALDATQRDGKVLPSTVDRVKAMVVATENFGNFFGQPIFIVSGGILFVSAFMERAGYPVNILKVALFSIPTALAAYCIVSVRNRLLDRALHREFGEGAWRE